MGGEEGLAGEGLEGGVLGVVWFCGEAGGGGGGGCAGVAGPEGAEVEEEVGVWDAVAGLELVDYGFWGNDAVEGF